MAVNLIGPQKLYPIAGVSVGAVNAGIRKSPGEDLTVIAMSEDTTVAGVFTQNRARAAPVEIAMRHLFEKDARHPGKKRALVVNSGNANAGLGQRGIEDCLYTCQLTADSLDMDPCCIIPFSTGVIGEPIPLEKFKKHMRSCVESKSENNWLAAARAIMTTDTVPKAVSKVIDIGNSGAITITGIAKGSGMIMPNMATMLAFIATDACIDTDDAQNFLSAAVNASFNCISVDGDTSTNDACILLSTGNSGVRIGPESQSALKQAFVAGLSQVMGQLAQAIVRDGEGATKFVTICVTGGKHYDNCKDAAMSIANSPLVKTAFFAADPNWGRIYAAVGNALDADFDIGQVSIRINEIEVMKGGALASGYRERDAAEAMKADEFTVSVALGADPDIQATVWTTDLSYEYVRINADYRS